MVKMLFWVCYYFLYLVQPPPLIHSGFDHLRKIPGTIIPQKKLMKIRAFSVWFSLLIF